MYRYAPPQRMAQSWLDGYINRLFLRQLKM
jgi:hypothetical protein